jgi:UDP-glucuronate 4-epimerase
MNSPILVTGAAGFIGSAVAHKLLDRGEEVIGVDSFYPYYDPALKEARSSLVCSRSGFKMIRADIADAETMASLVKKHRINKIVHLAAQAGVRYSIDEPFAYSHSNLHGHLSILEAARHADEMLHLVYASSSSVYGDRPLDGAGFCEEDPCIAPVSLYAATKRSAELMSSSYAHLYGIPQTGLRFFTVYGPWGRPDMAYFSFTKRILNGEPIEVYGNGNMARDFTYIDDIVQGVIGALDNPPHRSEHRILNIGDSKPVGLLRMIEFLELALGRSAIKIMRPMQAGDVTSTFADVSRLESLTGYRPKVMLEDGLLKFVEWYREFYS